MYFQLMHPAMIIAGHIALFAVVGFAMWTARRSAPAPFNEWSVIVPIVASLFGLAFLIIVPHAMFPRP